MFHYYQNVLKNKSNGKKQYKRYYVPISKRKCTFKQRGIREGLLTTILAEIKRPLRKSGCYKKLKTDDNVEDEMASLLSNSGLSDKCHDVIVFVKHPNMPDAEAVFYYIRNAFAHGSFQIVDEASKRVFLLESAKGNVIKAQMRLKESTLMNYVRLTEMSTAEIKQLRNLRAKSRQR